MVPDIYDMTLNADVVVLSGCQTALGKHVRQGPIGLARAFVLRASARGRLVMAGGRLRHGRADEAVYRGMLIDELTRPRRCAPPSATLAAGRRWASAYFSAPFVLQATGANAWSVRLP